MLGEYADDTPRGEAQLINVEMIGPNPQQPRKAFSDEELAELAQSIEENGLLQPLLLRPAPKLLGKYELVTGERRLRAVRKLGWTEVPAVTREVDDDTPGLGGNAGYNRALDEDHFAFECPVALSFVPVELDDAIGIARTLVSDVAKIGFAALSQDND